MAAIDATAFSGPLWFDISSDGTAAIGDGTTKLDGSDTSKSFRWTAPGGVVPLGVLPGATNNYASGGVSSDGSTVIGISGDSIYRWNATTGMVALAKPPGYDHTCTPEFSHAAAGGTIVTGLCLGSDGQRYFRWVGNAPPAVVLLPPGGVPDHQPASTEDGSTVFGTFTNASGRTRGFRWTNTDEAVEIGLSAFQSCTVEARWGRVHDVSSDGKTIVGGCSYPVDGGNVAREAFRWTPSSGALGLDPLPGDVGSIAESVSADGSLVAGESLRPDRDPLNPTMVAVLWDAQGKPSSVVDLLATAGVDTGGMQLRSAQISPGDKHVIWGDGTTATGQRRAWVARLP